MIETSNMLQPFFLKILRKVADVFRGSARFSVKKRRSCLHKPRSGEKMHRDKLSGVDIENDHVSRNLYRGRLQHWVA